MKNNQRIELFPVVIVAIYTSRLPICLVYVMFVLAKLERRGDEACVIPTSQHAP